MAVNKPRAPRSRGDAAALPAPVVPPADNQHLLIDRSEEAALVEELIARREAAPAVPAPSTSPAGLPDWLSEAQALMLTEALRDPAPAILTILQGTHPAEDINARCLVLADEMEAQWRFLAVKLTDLDRLILRTTLDALLLLHSQDATFDGRRLGVARRLEARLMADYQVPTNG